MDNTKLYIKNMVCTRCIMVVENVFSQLSISVNSVSLGDAVLPTELTQIEKDKLQNELIKFGFALIDDRKSRTIERIKNLVTDLIQNQNNNIHVNYSQYLSKELGMDYSYLSNLFSSIENSTIEKYIINQKVEKIKELMMYDELSLNEIADLLHYSSIQALSNQFKKTTGFSPVYYKKLKENKRNVIN